jgi:hypothetical protein
MWTDFYSLPSCECAPIEDEGELIIPRAMGWDPVDDKETMEGDVKAEFFLEFAAGRVVRGFVGPAMPPGRSQPGL